MKKLIAKVLAFTVPGFAAAVSLQTFCGFDSIPHKPPIQG